jgi:hypothetical protein
MKGFYVVLAFLVGASVASRVEIESREDAPEICWRACFPEKPECPRDWVCIFDQATYLLSKDVLTLPRLVC